MNLRFASLKAMEAAFGRKLRVRDSFAGDARLVAANDSGVVMGNDGRAGRPRKTRRRALGPTPHDILWEAVTAVLDGVEREFENAVPGRKYRLDIAVPAARLAVEVDGWEWHGKHKGDFTRDRERQNLLTIHGWRILRFTAGQIRKDVAGCVELIRKAILGERLV